MTENLSQKIAEYEPDDLIVGTIPAVHTGAGVIAQGAGELKRGTLLAKNSTTGKLVILGTTPSGSETLEPYAVLCDGVKVPDNEDANVAVYLSGKFNANKITVKDGYTLSESDKDKLRAYGIEFTAALKY